MQAGRRVLIAAHGNSLRALVKYLDQISDEDIVELNIPTGIPLVYELDAPLAPIRTTTWAIPKPRRPRLTPWRSRPEMERRCPRMRASDTRRRSDRRLLDFFLGRLRRTRSAATSGTAGRWRSFRTRRLRLAARRSRTLRSWRRCSCPTNPITVSSDTRMSSPAARAFSRHASTRASLGHGRGDGIRHLTCQLVHERVHASLHAESQPVATPRTATPTTSSRRSACASWTMVREIKERKPKVHDLPHCRDSSAKVSNANLVSQSRSTTGRPQPPRSLRMP